MRTDRREDPRATHHGLAGGLGVVGAVGVALVSVNLRPGATSVGPVLQEVRAALGIGGPVAGLVTSLPCICFGLVGAVAVGVSRRIGMTRGVVLGLLAVVAGVALRSLTSSGVVFLALSALLLSGMALGNILVPAWIKRHSTDGGTRGMAVYSTGLTTGGTLGALLSAPLAQVAPGGWRGSLALWSVVAALAVTPWLVLARREGRSVADHAAPIEAPAGGLRRSTTAIALSLYFGMQSLNAYVQFGWLPQIWRDAGLTGVQAGLWLAVLSGLGIAGGMVMPGIVSRRRTMAVVVVLLGALLLAGYLGLLVAPATTPWLWAVLLGVSGWAFPGALAMITARTRHPHVTAQLSGFVQPIGYLIAAVGPVAVGVVHQVTGGWTLVLLLLMATGVVMTAAGLVLTRSGDVDDEIAARAR